MVTLYTTHCPKCRVLERQFDKMGVNYTLSEDTDKLVRAGYQMAPMVELEDGTFLNFKEAFAWAATGQKG